MRRFSYLLAAVLSLAALVSSCQREEPQKPSVDPDTPDLRDFALIAGVEDYEEEDESRAIFRLPNIIRWVDTDKLKVYDASGYGKKFGTAQSDVQRAEFRCGGWWEGTVPVMAVHSWSDNIDDCEYTTGGKYTAYLNERQLIVNRNSNAKGATASIGKVTQVGDHYEIEVMQNMYSLLAFTLKSPNVKSVTLEGLNSEVIAGWIDITYQDAAHSYSTWTANADPTKQQKSIFVYPGVNIAPDGCFPSGQIFNICVLNQTFTNGITLTMKNRDNKEVRRTITQMEGGTAVQLERNRRHLLNKPLDDGVVIEKEDLTLTLDFSETWPFNEPCVDKLEQTKTGLSGETYTFTQDAQTYTFEIANRLLGDEETSSNLYYEWRNSNCLRFSNPTSGTQANSNGSWIKLPVIEGRMLHTVTVSGSNSFGTRRLALNTVPSVSDAFDSIGVPPGGSCTVTDKSLNYDTSYYLVLTSADRFQITSIELTYGKF